MPQSRRRSTLSAVPAAARDAGPPINKVSEGRSKKLSFLWYGDIGIGKTRLVSTCAELPGKSGGKARVLILRPPVDHTDSIVDNSELIDEWVLHDWAEADDALLYCRNDGAKIYDWVWLDSLSLWQDQGLDDIWEQVIVEKPHRARYGLDKQEYGINMGRIGRWVRHMVGCPDWHFGVTCHARITESTESEEDPEEKLMPWVQGKMMAPKICGYMNVVGYMHWAEVGGGNKKRQARVIDLNSSEKYYAKDQFSCSANGRFVAPTMPKIMESILATGVYKSGTFKTNADTEATGGSRRTNTKRRRRAVAGRK